MTFLDYIEELLYADKQSPLETAAYTGNYTSLGKEVLTVGTVATYTLIALSSPVLTFAMFAAPAVWIAGRGLTYKK